MKSLIFLFIMFLAICSSAQNNPLRYPGFERFLPTRNANFANSFGQKSGLVHHKFPFQFKPEDLTFQAETNFSIENNIDKPTRNVIYERIMENILKSANQDTLLMDSLYHYTFETPADSVLTEKIVYCYNPAVSICTITKCLYDTVSNALKFATKDEFYYNKNGKDTLSVSYTWKTEKSEWLPSVKYVTTYDSKNNITSKAFYIWHNLTKKWWGQNKQVYEFDDKGNNTLQSFYTWNDARNKWQGTSKNEYGFDEAKNNILTIAYKWSPQLFDWLPATRLQDTFNAEGIQTSSTSSVWDDISKDWIYQGKSERETDMENGSQLYAYYQWDLLLNCWMGLYKEAYSLLDDNKEMLISFSWNAPKQKWEASVKQIYEPNETLNGFSITEYVAQDSVIQDSIICGFNDKSEISNIWITPSCPNQTCNALDSERVEGTASILWNYNINGNYYATGGFCQIQINNDRDFTQNTGIALNCKVLTPSPASFIIRLTEISGEVWSMEFPDVLADSSGEWKQLVFSFPNLILNGAAYDGIFDSKQIKNIQLRLNVPKGIKTSGSVLIDNLCAVNIYKTDNWRIESVTSEIHDEYGYLVSSVSKRWNPALQQFITFHEYKVHLEYDSYGQLTLQDVFEKDEFATDWVNIERHILNFDENRNLTLDENYIWDSANAGLIGSWKNEREYDWLGNNLSSINYQWNVADSTWIYANKQENEYNDNGNLISNANYDWKVDLQKWIGTNKTEMVFNDRQEEIKSISYIWDTIDNDWKISNVTYASYFEDLYNPDGKITAHVCIEWNESVNEWCPTEKYYYSYSGHSITTALPPQHPENNNLAEIWPNPASDYINILVFDEFESTVAVYSNNGRLLKKTKTYAKITTLPVGDLPKGIYIIQIASGNNILSEKLIIH